MISSLITIIRKIPLVIHILIGGCLGSFFAAVCPEQSWIGIFGELFVKALKSVAPLDRKSVV